MASPWATPRCRRARALAPTRALRVMRQNPCAPRLEWCFALCLVSIGAAASAPARAQNNTLVEVDKFTPENGGYLGAAFGGDVAISGDTAVIGAARRDFGFPQHDGQAYVFTRPSSDAPWEFLQVQSPTGALPAECFGHSVAIEGDLIVIGSGAPESNDLVPRGRNSPHMSGPIHALAALRLLDVATATPSSPRLARPRIELGHR